MNEISFIVKKKLQHLMRMINYHPNNFGEKKNKNIVAMGEGNELSSFLSTTH